MTLSPEIARIVFWLCVASCAVAQVAIVWTTWRGLQARRLTPVAGAEPGGRNVPERRGPELMWAILPAIALIFVFAGTWKAVGRVSDADTATPQHPPATVSGAPSLLAYYTFPPRRVHARIGEMSHRSQLVMSEPAAAESVEPLEYQQQ